VHVSGFIVFRRIEITEKYDDKILAANNSRLDGQTQQHSLGGVST
jgi:hypothetical protein